MKKHIFTLIATSLIFTGCTPYVQQASNVPAHAEVTVTPTPTPIEEVTPTQVAEPTQAPEEPEIELSSMHFDLLDIDLPYFAIFDEEGSSIDVDKRTGCVYFSDKDNGVACEVIACLLGDDINTLTDQPTEYNQYFF